MATGPARLCGVFCGFLVWVHLAWKGDQELRSDTPFSRHLRFLCTRINANAGHARFQVRNIHGLPAPNTGRKAERTLPRALSSDDLHTARPQQLTAASDRNADVVYCNAKPWLLWSFTCQPTFETASDSRLAHWSAAEPATHRGKWCPGR